MATATIRSQQPTLLTLPCSVMETIYNSTEYELGVRDIPSECELDQSFGELADKYQFPQNAELHRMTDWWGAKLHHNLGTKKLRQGDWEHMLHETTGKNEGFQEEHCAIRKIPGLDIDDEGNLLLGRSSCNINAKVHKIELKQVEKCLIDGVVTWFPH